jgi:hypothetical protein
VDWRRVDADVTQLARQRGRGAEMTCLLSFPRDGAWRTWALHRGITPLLARYARGSQASFFDLGTRRAACRNEQQEAGRLERYLPRSEPKPPSARTLVRGSRHCGLASEAYLLCWVSCVIELQRGGRRRRQHDGVLTVIYLGALIAEEVILDLSLVAPTLSCQVTTRVIGECVCVNHQLLRHTMAISGRSGVRRGETRRTAGRQHRCDRRNMRHARMKAGAVSEQPSRHPTRRCYPRSGTASKEHSISISLI